MYQILLWTIVNGELKQLQQIGAKKELINANNLLGGRVSSRYESEL